MHALRTGLRPAFLRHLIKITKQTKHNRCLQSDWSTLETKKRKKKHD